MPLNHYLSLGNSGLRVSPFCVGAMTFGEDWGFGSGETEPKQMLNWYGTKAPLNALSPQDDAERY
jgi:hypothetical protein